MQKIMNIPYQSPKQIESIIRRKIVGQDEGVRAVATAISSHLMRIHHNQENPDMPMYKNNLLIIGPTGCGKTESIETAIKDSGLPIPVVVINASMLTSSGYKGKNTEEIMQDLFWAAAKIYNKDPFKYLYIQTDWDKDKTKKEIEKAIAQIANKGIIILDEIDKIRIDRSRRREDNLFPESCQRQLLKMIEGGTNFGSESPYNLIDTKDILFICAGAHIGLEETIQERLYPSRKQKPAIGFRFQTENAQETENKKIHTDLTPTTEDLIAYGYIHELVGRLPIRCKYNELSTDILYRILTESKLSATNESIMTLAKTGTKLEYTDGALRAIADKAYKEHTGARGLRSIVCKITNELLYEQSGKCGARYTITAQNIRENTIPVPTGNSVDVGTDDINHNEVQRRLNELSQQHESKNIKERKQQRKD